MQSNSSKPEAAGEHPAIVFAREVRALSVALPSPARHERNTTDPANAQKMWDLYGPQREF